jgi:hypothetical protein
MVTKSHQLRPDSLPPLVRLKVIEEAPGRPGVDYFDVAPRERLCDTPAAIGRVFKTTQYYMRMVVSAEESGDLDGKPLTYHWSVLRGDADRIEIKRLNQAGSAAELTIPYHTRLAATESCPIESNRVDIGVFVHNGDHYSAPAFVSFFFLDNEQRTYDQQQRIMSVDYAPAGRRTYVDPLIDLPKAWRDEYHYGQDGQLVGWTRIRGEQQEQFTAAGRLILKRDDQGQPTETAAVRYVAEPAGKGATIIQERVAEPE